MFSDVEPSAIDSGIEAGAFLPKSDEIYSSHKPNTDSSRTNIQQDNYICVYDMSNSYVVPAGKARLRSLEASVPVRHWLQKEARAAGCRIW